MEYTIQPPAFMTYILLGVLAVVVISMFLKRGEWKKKLFALGFSVVIVGVLLFLFRKPITLTVDEAGIKYARTKETEISWSDIKDIETTDNYLKSEYRAKIKTNGTAVGDYRTGWFKLQNGETAKLLMEQDERALIIRTGETLHIIAPDKFEEFREAVYDFYPY